MKKYLLLIIIAIITNSCTKDSALAEKNLAQKMIQDKAWFLEYDQTGTVIKTYVGQPTYYINFLKNGGTLDSDGLNGTYTIEKINSQLQINVQAKTINGNPIAYVYDVLSIGYENLILSYTLNGKTTQLYYKSKR
ncbi:MAG: hypothetical protein ACR2IM_09695 [Sediminibacterium sp.]|jgi:hypothetical protein